jgi:hypothetical protein
MRGYEGRDPADVTAMFRIAYDGAIRRCDVCERCGEAPVSKVLRVKDSVWVRLTRRRICWRCARRVTPPVGGRRVERRSRRLEAV